VSSKAVEILTLNRAADAPERLIRVTQGELQLLWCVAPTEEVVQSCAGHMLFEAA
jgi:hypothetical protein